MGGNGGGKKNMPGRKGISKHHPTPGWGGRGGQKIAPPPAVVGGEEEQAVLGLVGLVNSKRSYVL